jgi:hypothetical protein
MSVANAATALIMANMTKPISKYNAARISWGIWFITFLLRRSGDGSRELSLNGGVLERL